MGYIENGRLFCKGRKDSQVKYKGYRIDLSDIESNISLIDSVSECAVVAKYNDSNVAKTIKAFVVADKEITAEYIQTELKKYIAHFAMMRANSPKENGEG